MPGQSRWICSLCANVRMILSRASELVNDRKVLKAGVRPAARPASFSGRNKLRVVMNEGSEVRQISAPVILINTGARPTGRNWKASTRCCAGFHFCTEPGRSARHLLILGGGYVALEYGQMFRRFGSQVTIIQRSSQLLGREDTDVAATVRDILVEDGVEVLLDTTALKVGAATLGQLRSPCKPRRGCAADGYAFAGGNRRDPNTEQLNLAAAGVEVDPRGGFIRTNEFLETSVPGIYALGDGEGRPGVHHISYDDFRIMRSRLIEGKKVSIEARLVPYVLFIDPQVARVACRRRKPGAEDQLPPGENPDDLRARAIELDRTRGFIKALVTPTRSRSSAQR